VQRGAEAVYEQSLFILSIPGRLIGGSLQPDEARLLGYKGMFDMYQSVQESEAAGIPSGIGTLSFFASISLSLGLLNLLPIPALDGGRIMFVLPEIFLRRRVPINFENVVNAVSISMLILLMLYINAQDFINPVTFP